MTLGDLALAVGILVDDATVEVASAQNAVLTLERAAVQVRRDQLVATISLIRALGGGW